MIKGRQIMKFQWLEQRLGKSKQKSQLPQREPKKPSAGSDSEPQQITVDLLRSLLKTAIADAEEIVASIKMRAQAEAEAEAEPEAEEEAKEKEEKKR